MLFTRFFLEKQENERLAPYAMRSSKSKGRKFTEPETEYRTVYQRDRDRILHTTAFRRLEYKTQVFINFEGDHYRTRLTHTLEVAQIGRSIGRALGVNEDLIEAICLAHDLGHPPFGHSGEAVLNKLMSADGGFNHNLHSYKIITELEERYSNFKGLNLSYEVLEGVIKHETDYDISVVHEFDPLLRGHIEAQIANIADELAYTAHDLDDGLRSGILTTQQLANIELWQIITDKSNVKDLLLNDIDRHTLVRELIGLEVSNLLQHSNRRLKEVDPKSPLEVQKLAFNIINFDNEMLAMNRQIKDYLYINLYRNYRLVRMSFKAERIINSLFEAYCAEPRILPPHVQSSIELRGTKETVCNYIAGMTDRFATEEYKKLFDPTELP